MFAIHSLSGFSLRAPLEQLAKSAEAKAMRRDGSEYEPTLVDGDDGVAPSPTAAQAYKALLPEALERGPVKHAWQVMSKQVIRVRLADSIELAWRVLVKSNVRQAVVVNDEGTIVGLVSERDLLTSVNLEDGHLRDVLGRQVADVMQTPVVCADPVTDIRRIAQVLVEYRQSGVPIVQEEGRAVGFVSRGDILRSVVNDPPLSLWV